MNRDAAENSGAGTTDTGSPAKFANAITVGAIDSNGRRVQRLCALDPLTNGSASSTGASLDFMAPGMAEVGLICQSNPCPWPDCTYPTFPCRPYHHPNLAWGTSYGAPKVCAAISLILAEAIELGVVNSTTWQGLTWAQVVALLRVGARDQVSHVPGVTGDPADTPGRDDHYGWGLIDVRASICELRRVYGPGCP